MFRRCFSDALAVCVLAVLAGCSSQLEIGGAEEIVGEGSALVSSNGITANGITANGITANGITANGITANGITANGITANGITANGLREDENTRTLLKYIYSCAMPADAVLAIDLDENSATPLDAESGFEGMDFVAHGGLGLAPEWGQEGGSCDASCQRWVSACVIARVNAFGASVMLSFRGPHPALTVPAGSEEALTYQRREGAFFGNIFAQREDSPGLFTSAPVLYACSGPTSNVPTLSLRFCSSEFDDCIVETVGHCEEAVGGPAVCDTTLGPSGEVTNCYSNPDLKSPATLYTEVITAYVVEDLEAVCGNRICETQGGETNASCPADCHPDSWSNQVEMGNGMERFAFDSVVGGPTIVPYRLGAERYLDLLAVDAVSSALVGGVSEGDIDFGGLTLPATDGRGHLLKITAEGVPLWGHRLGADVNAVAVDAIGNVAVVGTMADDPHRGEVAAAPGSSSKVTVAGAGGFSDVLFAVFDAAGNRKFVAGLGGPHYDHGTRSLVADSAGNWLLAGEFDLAGNFGAPLISAGQRDAFVTKFSPTGTALWAVNLGSAGIDRPLSLTVDAFDNLVLVASVSEGDAAAALVVYRLNGADGSVLSSRSFTQTDLDGRLSFEHAVVGPANEVYLAGDFYNLVDFGDGAGDVDGGSDSFFLLRLNPDLSTAWVRTALGSVHVQDLKLDAVDNVVVTGAYGGTQSGIDFGAGVFKSRDADTFFAAYTGAGDFVWAIPSPGYGRDGAFRKGTGDSALLTGFEFDTRGRIVGSGILDGFMLWDNRMIVNWVEIGKHQADAFAGAFVPPCSLPECDTTAPVIVPESVPADMRLEATGGEVAPEPHWAAPWFITPTATDTDDAGNFGNAVVSCDHPSRSKFPVGVTVVTCVATDSHGNDSAPATFTVTVVNERGPLLSYRPSVAPLTATSGAGAVGTYVPPTAWDQLDGDRPVTCTKPSGSVFPIGTTRVTCSASDLVPNTSSVSFDVVVTSNGVDAVPPVIQVPSAGVTAPASSGGGVVVNYGVSATDDRDGAVGVSCSPASGSVFQPGTTTVSCTAQDAAGNVAVTTFPVTVTFGWGGFLQPINNDGTSLFKLGQTIPVKFTLNGVTDAVAHLTVAKITNNIQGVELEAVSTSAADSGNQFRFTGGSYLFNLSTRGLSSGTWLLRADLHDGTSRTVKISLR